MEAKDGMVFLKMLYFSKHFFFVTSLEREWLGWESSSFLKNLICETHLKYQCL